MPILYKWITAFLALTGCASLVMTGELIPFMMTSGLAVFPAYYRFIKGYPPAPRWAIGIFSAATLMVFIVDSLSISGDVFLAVAHLTITFHAIKGFDLKEPWDHLQVYFMSLLQLIIASEFTRSLAFGGVFIIFMIMLVTAMVLSHFLKEQAIGRISIRKPVVVISLMTLVATVVIFVLLPRTSQRFFGKSHYRGIRTVGFSERVSFGSIGNVKLDPTVVMRIEIAGDGISPFYWRGIALDHFDGISWRDSDRSQIRIRKEGGEFVIFPYDGNEAVEQKIYMEPMDSDVIFGLAEISGIKSESYFLMADENLGLSIPRKSGRRITYTVFSIIRDSELVPRQPQRYLQIPDGFERIVQLAGDVTRGMRDNGRKALAIEQYLKQNYTYSLNVRPSPEGINPIEDFLFTTRRGFCEHYATAMVMMLRGIGIPSRIVNGFLGGDRNEYGGYIIVKQSDAHSWVEALINGRWKRFDPTPPAPPLLTPGIAAFLFDSLQYGWSRYVIGFSFIDQREIMSRILSAISLPRIPSFPVPEIVSIIVPVAAIAALVSAILFAIRKVRFRRYDPVTKKYIQLRKILGRRGMAITPDLTPGDLRKRIEILPVRNEMEAFLDLYELHRFGRKKMGQDQMTVYASLLKKIQGEL